MRQVVAARPLKSRLAPCCLRDTHAAPPTLPNDVEHRAPPAPQVEHAPIRLDSDLLGHVVVLAPLGLFEAEGEVAVVLGAAEVSQLAVKLDHGFAAIPAELPWRALHQGL